MTQLLILALFLVAAGSVHMGNRAGNAAAWHAFAIVSLAGAALLMVVLAI